MLRSRADSVKSAVFVALLLRFLDGIEKFGFPLVVWIYCLSSGFVYVACLHSFQIVWCLSQVRTYGPFSILLGVSDCQWVPGRRW